jgi:osmotically-inducible protein OsmY
MDLNLAAVIIMGGWVVAIVAAGLALSLRPGGVSVPLSAAGAPEPASDSPASGARYEILLGSEAEVFGNVRGRVRSVQLRAQSRMIEAIELANGLEVQPVPASAILSADGQVVRLAEQWPEPPADDPPADAPTLREDAPVVSAEGKRLGKLKVVCYEPVSGRVTALAVEGRGTPPRRLVPFDRVTSIGPYRIATGLRAADWASLPGFATDWEIEQEALSQLRSDPSLESARRAVQVEVVDQRVRLQGYVADQRQAERVAQLIRSIPGVLALDLKLLTDDDLARAVRDAIAKDPAIAKARLQVSASAGVVDITGEVPDRLTARRIDGLAIRVPGVQVVHNLVVVGREERLPA